MTDRLGQVKEQLHTVAQLEGVMTAMRGIASAHLHEANLQLRGNRSYSDTIAMAIGDALALLPSEAIEHHNEHEHVQELIIVVSAEQGFAGVFNERIMDVVEQYRDDHDKFSQGMVGQNAPTILLVGTRGRSVAQERKIPMLDTFAMATRVGAIPALAIKLADLIYKQIANDGINRVTLISPRHTDVGEIITSVRSLIPFDYSRFPARQQTIPPLVMLDPIKLINKLAEEYVFAELCDALVLSYAAENEARVRAMVRARANITHTRATLQAHYQQYRQDQITAEITELTIGRIAGSRSQ